MENLGFKLKKLRKYKGINQDELAQLLAVGKTTISNYETGYTVPPSANLRQLAQFFNVTVDDLIDDKISVEDLIGKKEPTVPYAFKEDVDVSFSKKNIPVYLNFSTDNVPIHQFIFSTSFVGEGNIFGLKVSGDRMDRAALPDGSIAIIRSQEYADDNEVIAAIVDDNPAFICRYFRQGELVVLENESSNPVYHRPTVVNPKEQSFKIIGKVIKSIQSVY